MLQARHSGRQALAGDSARVKQRNIATPPKVIRHVTLGDRARRDGCRGEHRLGDAGPIGSASWLLRQARATCQSAHPQANCAPLYRRLRSTPQFPHAPGSRCGRCARLWGYAHSLAAERPCSWPRRRYRSVWRVSFGRLGMTMPGGGPDGHHDDDEARTRPAGAGSATPAAGVVHEVAAAAQIARRADPAGWPARLPRRRTQMPRRRHPRALCWLGRSIPAGASSARPPAPWVGGVVLGRTPDVPVLTTERRMFRGHPTLRRSHRAKCSELSGAGCPEPPSAGLAGCCCCCKKMYRYLFRRYGILDLVQLRYSC